MKRSDWYILRFKGEAKRSAFTIDEAADIAKKLNIDFKKEKFSFQEFYIGINVELEHGTKFPQTNVTNNDPILSGKIAYAHLLEYPDYYTRLKKLESEANEYWSKMK